MFRILWANHNFHLKKIHEKQKQTYEGDGIRKLFNILRSISVIGFEIGLKLISSKWSAVSNSQFYRM